MSDFETKFTGKADIYDKFRPGYPEEFIDFLFEVGILSECDKVADIGCGTGILSEALAKRKRNAIIGVEPNLDMLRMARQRLVDYGNCILVPGMAEKIPLDDHSVSCVTVAQAFHWFDREKFKGECQRILKQDGSVVLLWNATDNNSPINIEIANINKKLCEAFDGYSSRSEENVNTYSMFFRNNECWFKLFKNDLVLRETNFIGRSLSRSYAPNDGDSNYEEYVYQLKKVYKQYSKNGTITIPNNTRCYYGKM